MQACKCDLTCSCSKHLATMRVLGLGVQLSRVCGSAIPKFYTLNPKPYTPTLSNPALPCLSSLSLGLADASELNYTPLNPKA